MRVKISSNTLSITIRVMLLCGTDAIRDAPSVVSRDQLIELGIRIADVVKDKQ